MRGLLGSFAIAFSLYSRIPMPCVEWTKERMKYALCFFPLVGAAVGLLTAAALIVPGQLGFPWFAAAFATVMPLLVTGGIHMDGFLDVTDAKSSHGDRDKKLEIMKDPHTGAFAIIGCGVYLILYAGCMGEMREIAVPAFAGTFVLSRALSGLAVVCFPMAKTNGLAATFSVQADKRIVSFVMIFYIIAAEVYIWFAGGALAGVVTACLALVIFVYYYVMSTREFGGTTGDLAGYFLQLLELCLAGGLAVVSHVLG